MKITVSRHFLSWLNGARISLAFTTYQTNRLFLIGLKPDGSLSAFERHFERPMGLFATPRRLYMNSLWQIWEIEDALPAGETYHDYDRLYVPRRAHTTGHLDVHDIALDGDGRVIFVNTLHSCLASLSERYSFRPLWKPPFVSKLAPEDRCHLNGLAMADGHPAYVTTVSRSDVLTGWRQRRESGGCVIDVEDNEIVLDTLSMPHSPRVYRDRLWLLNSGTGELGYVDRAAGRFEPIAFCPGYLRGLAFHGEHAIVGLSKPRREGVFQGLTLDQRLREKDTDARCGLWAVNLKTGNIDHWLELDGVVIELYDVVVIPETRRPMALGFKNDEIQRLLTIDTESKPIFQALEVPDPASHAAPHPDNGPPSAATTPALAPSRKPVSPEAEAAYRRANEFARKGDFEQAAPLYEEALRLAPEHVNANVNLGTARYRLGNREAASDCWRRALALDPRSVKANMNLGMLLRDAGDTGDALRCLEAARAAAPDDPAVLRELGPLLLAVGRPQDAQRCLEHAVRVQPRSGAAHNDLGAYFLNEQKDAEALPLFEQAVRLERDLAAAHVNLGVVYEGRGQIDAAHAAWGKALNIQDVPALALRRELLCPPVWSSVEELESYRTRASRVIEAFSGRDFGIPLSEVQSSRAEVPFNWSYMGRDNLALKRRYAGLFAAIPFPRQPLDYRPAKDGPWKIVFAATHTHEGVFLRCMAGLIDRLDRGQFQVAIACQPGAAGQVRHSLRRRDVELIPLPLRFDHAIERLRAARADLLYYWEVGSDAVNYFLPFCRLAPVQCTGWGWPDTSAAPELDIHVTSEALAPSGAERFFSESLARMPHLPAYAVRPPVQAQPRRPEHFGLPEGAHLYLCIQNLRKVHPELDAMFAGILRGDARAVVACVHDKSPAPGESLLARWRHTLPEIADRLFVLPRRTPTDYMHLIASAAVILDTPHFSGSNTAYDALAAGAPMVTLPGETPRSRYAAALYTAIGIEDGIASSPEEYVAKALAIGTDPAARAELQARIAAAAPAAFENRGAVSDLEHFLATACRQAA